MSLTLSNLSTGFIFLVALLHFYFFLLESIFWRKRARKVFGLPQSTVEICSGMASNQGFYNLLLTSGLLLSWHFDDWRWQIIFLTMVSTAGMYGAITAYWIILFVQFLPAAIGIIVVNFDDNHGKVDALLWVLAANAATAVIAAVWAAGEKEAKKAQKATSPAAR